MAATLQESKAELFRALANPSRIRLLEELRGGGLTVGELCRRIGTESSNVSQHLSILRGQALVIGQREGTSVRYSVVEFALYQILDAARAIIESRVATTTRLLEEDAALST